jgi:hypothetical protein
VTLAWRNNQLALAPELNSGPSFRSCNVRFLIEAYFLKKKTHAKYLEENGLIEGNKNDGYRKTKKGDSWHEILRKHPDLVGVLTRELSGYRTKRW